MPCYRFGPFLLDSSGRRLCRDDRLLRVTSKAFDVLVLLVEARQRVVSRNEIFERLWPDTAVEDNNLSQQVHRLRRLLDDGASGQSPIATIPGRGFRFVAAVEEVAAPPSWPMPALRNEASLSGGTWWPAPADSLIGREDDVERIASLVRKQPLVTLTGPGGVGKTRLAIEVGWRIRHELADGARWIDLTRATRGEDLVPLTSEALGLADVGGRSAAIRLREWLADRDCLLVFDNFEHILDAAPLVLHLRAPDSALRVLVTSRAPIAVRGEHEYVVQPLRWQRERDTADDTDEELRHTPAVRLFLDRYGLQPGLTAPAHLAPRDVSRLCERLDGLPLAIELAAARARLVPPADLIERDRLAAFLPRAARDVPERQQSIFQSIEWSYSLLDDGARRALDTVTVFTGGFTPAAAATVLVSAGVAHTEAAAYDALDTLRQHSLVAFDRQNHDSRLRVLETVREFCLERRRPQDDAAFRNAHAAWVLDAFERHSLALRSAQHELAMGALVADHANLLAALRWSEDDRAMVSLAHLATSAAAFWHTANLFREGRYWIDRALDRTEATADGETSIGTTLLAASALMAFHADWASSRGMVDAVLRRPDAGAPTVLAHCLDAGLLAYSGDTAAAIARSRVALSGAQAAGDRWLEGLAGLFEGFALALSRQHDAAYRRLSQTPREIGFLDLMIDVNRALQALHVGRVVEAARLFGSKLHQRYGSYVPLRQIAGAIEGLGYVADRRGESRAAGLLLGAADHLRSQTAPLGPVWFTEHDRAIENLRGVFGDRLDLVWAEGASLSLDDALALAGDVATRAGGQASD